MADKQPIRLMDVERFTVGGVTVTPALRTLAVETRESVIEPRVMQVLITLHRRCGEVVGREALIDACWGGRSIGDDAINRAILKLRRALDEIGGGLVIETIAKVGYRLCAGGPGGPANQALADPVRPGRAGGRWLAGAVAGVIVALAVYGYFLPGSRERSPPSRIVVVRPLRFAANDAPAQRLSQDFTSDLSRTVLGHDGRLEFASLQSAPQQAAAFTVTGSVASIGRDLNAVVIVTKRDDPSILWSHDYTAPLNDADGLRKQVGTNVAAVLVCALGTEGLPEPVEDRTAALYLETCNLHAGDHRRETYLLRQVVARAPQFAGAWADLAISLAFTSEGADGKDAASMRRESRAAAMYALSLDPHLGRAYFALASLLPGIRNWTARERIIAAGLAAQPDCPQLYNVRARDLAAIGRQQDSIASNRHAVALDPLFPGKTATLARSLADAGRRDEAEGVILHMRETWPDNPYTWFARFETAARIGDAREAEAMLDDMRRRFFSASETAAWRTLLEARQAPSSAMAQRAIATLLDDRRRGIVTDAQLVEDIALLGRPNMALDLALRMPAQEENAFWFRGILQPLRADPRFMAVADRQGLYSIWRATGLWPDFCGDRSLRYDCRKPFPTGEPMSARVGSLRLAQASSVAAPVAIAKEP